MKKGIYESAEINDLKDKNFRIVDMVDIDFITSLCQRFTDITGFVTALLELDGTVVVATGWQDICTQFHRKNPKSLVRCTESDIYLGSQLEKGESYTLYKCKNGLTDAAIPLMIGGMHVANFFTGQMFLKEEKRDESYFRNQAEELGIEDVEGYIEAFHRVPVFSHREVVKNLHFLVEIVEMIAHISRSEEEIHTTLQSIGDGVIVTNKVGNISRMNPIAEDLTGWSMEEAHNKPLMDIFHIFNSQTGKECANPMDKVLETGKISGLAPHTQLKSKTGKVFQIADSIAPLRDKQGDITGTVLVFRDITQEYETQQALKISEERLRMSNEMANIAVWEYDGERNRFSGSENLLKIYGESEKIDWSLQRFIQRIHPKDRDYCRRILESSLERNGDDHFNMDYRILCPDGGTRWLSLIGQVNYLHGQNTHFARGCIIDITERKQMEQEKRELLNRLSQSQKMDAIGQLAGGVAHDINNMLTGIMNASQLLASPDILEDERNQYIQIIEDSITRASDLTEKLLTFSRKKADHDFHQISLHSIIDNCSKILENSIDKKIAISLQKDAQWDISSGDSNALQTAFLNLGINAAHAMPRGGEFTILTRNVFLDDLYCRSLPFDIAPGDFIELKFKDTGMGISKENIPRIFEPFFTTKGIGKGTGLGLATVFGTIQEHKGAIKVYSELNEGTVFNIYLPCSQEKMEPIINDTSLISGFGSILLVDDEENIRLTVKFLLEDLGYTIWTASNGYEAVEMYKEMKDKLDLVITDMMMPELNGKETFLKLREIDPHCRVIISSGFTNNENIEELKRLGLAGFIHKPFQNYELSQLVERVIKR